jgi:hypothetical protein
LEVGGSGKTTITGNVVILLLPNSKSYQFSPVTFHQSLCEIQVLTTRYLRAGQGQILHQASIEKRPILRS